MQQDTNLLHHVFFWLNNPSSQDERQQLIEGLRKLADAEQVAKIEIGIPAATPKREVIDDSYDVSLLLTFKSVEDHNNYQSHPVHTKFVEDCSHLWKQVRIYDAASV